MKTQDQIDEINRKRAECIQLLVQAKQIMVKTECSLGAQIISEAIDEITEGGMDEY